MSDTTDLPGHTKATRQDWLDAAKAVLIQDGVAAIKVQSLGRLLDVSRSSFYWYFTNRDALLDALLDHWRQTNTDILLEHAQRPAATITESVCHVFRCFLIQTGFDYAFDVAVRGWARHETRLRDQVDASDHARLDALAAMFVRHGYDTGEASTRARVLYYQQLGYYAVEFDEPIEARLDRVPSYLLCFTGRAPMAEEVASLCEDVRRAQFSQETSTQ